MLDQNLVEQVRRIYETRTEAEAINCALEEAVIREEFSKAFAASAKGVLTPPVRAGIQSPRGFE